MTEPTRADYLEAMGLADISVRRLERVASKIESANDHLIQALEAGKPRQIASAQRALDDKVRELIRQVQTPVLTQHRMDRAVDANRSQQAVLEHKLAHARAVLSQHGIEVEL